MCVGVCVGVVVGVGEHVCVGVGEGGEGGMCVRILG